MLVKQLLFLVNIQSYDAFLENAYEFDVDAISDGNKVEIAGMQHIEEAGIHSGDSSCVYPAYFLPKRKRNNNSFKIISY